jgi:hypothetical protein
MPVVRKKTNLDPFDNKVIYLRYMRVMAASGGYCGPNSRN